MEGMYSFAYVCATMHSGFIECFSYLQVVMSHPDLHQDEKYLWVWIAVQCANQPHRPCSFTYEQLSRAMNWSPKKIHSALFRLKIMGFLQGDIPIWYAEPTPEMMAICRELQPIFLSQKDFERQQLVKQRLENRQFIWNI